MIPAAQPLACNVAQPLLAVAAVLASVALLLSSCAGAPKVPQELSAPVKAKVDE